MQKSKTVWAGAAMVLLGLVGLVAPDVLEFLTLPDSPAGLIGAGVTTIFMRLGIAKHGGGGGP